MSDSFGFKLGIEGEKEFKNALRDINSDFKVLGSEMKLVTSQFEKQDKSIQAVTARNGVLNKEIDTQKNKVSTLESALNNSAESFGENDKRTKAWQIQLNNANADLNKMEKELDDNNKSLDEASDGFDDAGKEADKFGDEIEDSAKVTDDAGGKFEKLGSVLKGVAVGIGVAMVAIGTAAVTAGKKLFEMASDAAAAGDEIDKSSQRIGLSRQGYQEWEYVLSQNGASIETLENGMKKLNNTVDDAINGSSSAKDKFQRLGISMDDLKGKSREKIFEMTVQGLQGISDEGEKAAIAIDLLGKTSIELASLLNQTADSTEDLKNKASELGMVMSDESVDAAVHYTDAMDNLTRSFGGVKNKITSQLLPGFTMILDGLTGLITGQEGAVEQLKEGAKETVDQIAVILPKILDVLTGLISAIAEVAPDLIIALINGILENLPTLIDAATSIIMTIADGLIKALPQITEGALQLVLSLVDGIISNLPALLEAALVMIITLAAGLGDALPELIPSMIEAVILIVETLLGNMDLILMAAFQLISGLAQGLLNALPKLIEALPRIISSIITFLITSYPKMVAMGLTLIAQLGSGLIRAIPELIGKIPQIISSIMRGFTSGIPGIEGVGKNIIQGLWNGISSMIGWVKDKVGNAMGGIVKGVKGLLGIRSPSTVFAGIGENMGEGMGVGFTDAMRDVEKEMQKAIPTEFDAIEVDVGSNLNSARDMNQSQVVYQHTGIIEVRGINNQSELTSVVDIIMDQFRREARVL